jgi:hypothetical protein
MPLCASIGGQTSSTAELRVACRRPKDAVTSSWASAVATLSFRRPAESFFICKRQRKIVSMREQRMVTESLILGGSVKMDRRGLQRASEPLSDIVSYHSIAAKNDDIVGEPLPPSRLGGRTLLAPVYVNLSLPLCLRLRLL